ncbi:DUF7662 domain-containing protein [Hoeflea olei]|uniref:DUF7662 domain-containing protein n=1 Tax=Hoeflea olei TaxID=1480615 RepID=A0A1C1YXJ1_9HYPH|nr:hypothetical protein [Hoeflea olei]OCW58130.1 hypothetical protein AWJ14_15895 [Hoeflea olei]
MGKYEPLREFLASQTRDQIQMSFAEIEAVLGEPLPASKRFPAWWSNNTMNNVMTKEWLAAGFQSEQVDIAGEKLTFRRIKSKSKAEESPSRGSKASAASSTQATRPAYYGALKGTLTLDPSLDLTQPADPEWGRVYEDD